MNRFIAELPRTSRSCVDDVFNRMGHIPVSLSTQYEVSREPA